ncbi:fatty acid desaturase [Blastopirellula sp. J2-11]|uniref:fatty acid desaturase family protein n=1 Tax=Blastopirellula sp. J2-11 TaxID=2943192 RepID=UPI0021C92691|nr:fatty acid desaturase [Blastopirellula sp. J2-11]UUO06177.1 fatty acid desaturase [Blastopirellula sp. J2-11]
MLAAWPQISRRLLRPLGLRIGRYHWIGNTRIGIMQYRIVMSVHEASHRTLFFPIWINEAVGIFHASLVGITFVRYRQQHQAHHQAKEVDNDPDAYIYEPILRAPAGIRRVAIWLFGMVPEIVEKIRQKGVAPATAFASHKSPNRLHSFCVLVMQGGLFVALWFLLGWWAYFALWVAPLLTVALMLNRTRVTIEHGLPQLESIVAGGAYPQVRVDTIDILTNPFDRFVFAPFAFNFHYTHHKIPSIPHYNNTRLSEFFGSSDEGGSHRIRASYPALLVQVLWGSK